MVRLKLIRKNPIDDIKKYVPSIEYEIVIDSKREVVGRCVLRIGHNDNTYWGGNIGYCIYEKFRGHGYAYEACLLLFEIAKAKGLSEIYITCNPENIASKRTCEKLPMGVLLGIFEIPADNEMRAKGEYRKCIFKYTL